MSGLITYLRDIQSGILVHRTRMAGECGYDISYNAALINYLIMQAVQHNNVSGYKPLFLYTPNEADKKR